MVAKTDDIAIKPTLQAVVLADSFTNAFKPLTEATPKVLLPIGHAPSLEYVLEWLAAQGVEETYVFSSCHAEAIEEYLRRAGWLSSGAKDAAGSKDGSGGAAAMAVHTIASTNCVSAGEALRLVDHKHVIRNDFVLISGDVITNVDLSAALKTHRERRAKEKLAIMTVCMRRVGADVRELSYGDGNLTVALDAETNRIVHYEEHGGGNANAPGVNLDASLFGEVKNIRVRTDMMDCHIDICAPEFLMLFTDNFDYQHIAADEHKIVPNHVLMIN